MNDKNIKKCIVAILVGTLLLTCGFTLDIPVLSFRYDVLQGEDEDEDSGELFPSSVRHSFLFGIRETFNQDLWSSLKLGYVIKDFLKDQSGGDYSYVKFSDNTSWRVGDRLKLGFNVVGKRIFFDQPDRYGFPKDYYLFGAKIGADYKLFQNLLFNSWFKSNTYWNLQEEKSREEFSLSGGINSKIGSWALALRYRGVLRLPLGINSETERNFLNYGSFSLKWRK